MRILRVSVSKPVELCPCFFKRSNAFGEILANLLISVQRIKCLKIIRLQMS